MPITRVHANSRAIVGTNMNARFVEADTLYFPASIKLVKLLPSSLTVESLLQKAMTSVMWEKMVPWLEAYPNKVIAHLLLDGFKYGFFVPECSGTWCS